MKRAFSLIELVISIIVMGIVFLTIPTLMRQNSENNSAAILQQSIMDTKTKMALVLKSPWGCVGGADITIIGQPTPIFGNQPNFYAINGIDSTNRRAFSTVPIGTACNAALGESDINTFNGTRSNVILAPNPENNYMRDSVIAANMAIVVGNNNMLGNNDPTNNIKSISIATTAATTPPTNITLRAYSSNIGDSPTIVRTTW